MQLNIDVTILTHSIPSSFRSHSVLSSQSTRIWIDSGITDKTFAWIESIFFVLQIQEIKLLRWHASQIHPCILILFLERLFTNQKLFHSHDVLMGLWSWNSMRYTSFCWHYLIVTFRVEMNWRSILNIYNIEFQHAVGAMSFLVSMIDQASAARL